MRKAIEKTKVFNINMNNILSAFAVAAGILAGLSTMF